MMKRLGAAQLNTVWSWCAVNDSEKKVYFSLWTDQKVKQDGKSSYVVQESNWGVDEASGSRSAARNDQDAKLALVFDQGYEPFGYFIQAKDPLARPREIAATLTSFVMHLNLSRLEDGSIVGTLLKRIEL
jgi:hypothetical protein